MTVNRTKIEILRHIAFMLVILMLACNFGFAWFHKVPHQGSSMFYRRTLYIGGLDASMVTCVGVKDADGNVQYQPLYETDGSGEPVVDQNGDLIYSYAKCAELCSLLPGERQYFYTEIKNLKPASDGGELYCSLFLEDIYNTPVLDEHLYFAVTSPEVSMHNYYMDADVYTTGVAYAGDADVDPQAVFSHITGVPLTRHQTIPAGGTLRVYWYLYLDTEAGNECIGSEIFFEMMRLTFNS